jgi:antitoxin ParD1/3/4
MNIDLPPEQERWLKSQIALGAFASLEDAVSRIVADRMTFGEDDLAWAKPDVDEARAAASRGETVSLEAAIAGMDAHLASLKP